MCKKTCFLHFKCKYLAIYTAKVFENFSTHSYINLEQDPTVKYAKEKFKFLPFAIKMAILSVFFDEK